MHGCGFIDGTMTPDEYELDNANVAQLEDPGARFNGPRYRILRTTMLPCTSTTKEEDHGRVWHTTAHVWVIVRIANQVPRKQQLREYPST